MRHSLTVAVAVTSLAGAPVGRADPSTPQVDAIQLRREDAARVVQQQGALDPEHTAAPGARAAPAPVVEDRRGMQGTGVVLLGVAGATGLVALPLLVTSPPGAEPDRYSDWGKVLLAGSIVAGVVGLSLVVASRSVQIAPTVTASSVGVTLMSRL
jgi:hypothetical protein